jgi:hypothetical protein
VSERLGDLSSRERELVDAVASGDVLECSQLSIEQLSATDDPEHTIRGELLRELLLKRCDERLDPRGVRLCGARITGTLDLTGVEVPVGMELRGCNFDHPVLLEGAHLRWLTLIGSCLPALRGAGLQVDVGLFLQGLRATGHGERGAVRLPGARITGQLVLSGAELTSEAGPALGGDRLQVDGDVFLQELRATGHGEIGAVQLRGAHIIGTLYLRGAVLTNKAGPALVGDGLRVDGDLFSDGEFRATGHGDDGALRLVGARIGGQLGLRGAELTNKVGPALDCDRLQVDDSAFLDGGFRATGHGEDGAVRLLRAHITGELSMRDAVLTNEAGPALGGDRLQVDGDLFFQGLRATGHSKLGAVRLLGAHITGQLSLSGAELTNGTGPTLHGNRLQVDGGLFLDEGFRATGHGEDGAVRLLGAHITGQLVLSGAKLTNGTGRALAADGLQVNGDLFLDRGFRATGHGEDGAVRLLGAHITGQLVLRGAELTNEAGPTLHGDRLQVDGGLFLDEGFRATGHGEDGAVRLLGAHITGQLSFSGAKLTNEAGPALIADGLQVDEGSLFLDKGFRATGHSKLGAVRLLGAHVTGQLSFSGAKLTNEAGPALGGDRLQVDGDLFLGGGFRATGHSQLGAVRLLGAHITGQLSLSDAVLTNGAGPAVAGDRLQVDGDLFLGGGFRATGHGEDGAVQLPGAHIGQLVVSGAELTNEDGLVLDLGDAEAKTIRLSPEAVCPQGVAGRSTCNAIARRVDLSGFVYTSLADGRWSQWLHLIARHTHGYRPQPYQQLAAVRRAAGHDADVRKILIAQQEDLRERGGLGGRWARAVHYLWGALGGYGYRIGRIAFTLLIVLLVAAGLGIWAGHIPTSPAHYVAMHTAQADNPHSPCSLTEQIGVGIDRGLPLGTTGIRGRCDLDTTSGWGQALTWFTWVLQFFVWALATLFVAGYVGLIRKAT